MQLEMRKSGHKRFARAALAALALATGLAIAATPAPARAQAPAPAAAATDARPIRLIVPYPPGGPLDLAARLLAEQVAPTLGPVVVENRAGAGGNLGADVVAKAAPDGRTLVMGAVATHAINPWLYAKMPYQALTDFTPITLVARVPNVVVVNAQVAKAEGWNTLGDWLASLKRQPGKFNYGSGGNGSAGHLAGEMIKARVGVFAVHIPYAGGPAAQLGLLAGQVHFNVDNLAAAAANIKAGKLKALAVTSATRSPAMPEVPTAAEAGAAMGLKDFDIATWFGLFAPAGLAPAQTQKLNEAFTQALRSQPVQQRLASLMAEPAPMAPEAFASFVRAESAKYEKLVKAIGVKAE